jgi:hypothetical protein
MLVSILLITHNSNKGEVGKNCSYRFSPIALSSPTMTGKEDGLLEI